ncbi:MAG: hypothetical protein GY856_10650, partial [bacterium]|nr:hypothetical protein [bacterium]
MLTIDRSTGSLIVAIGLIFGAAVAGGAAEPPDHVGRPLPSQVTAELTESLATLHRVLPTAGDTDPSGKQLEQVLAASERLRAADLVMRAHFGTIRERLEEIEAGGEIFDRLPTAETSYRDAMDELLGAIEGPLGEIRELKSRNQKALPPAAGKAVHGELAAVRERLAVQIAT